MLESKTQVKSSKCSVVFAVIVGEQGTGKKARNVVFWCLLSLMENKTLRKAVNVVLCLLSLLESKTQEKQ